MEKVKEDIKSLTKKNMARTRKVTMAVGNGLLWGTKAIMGTWSDKKDKRFYVSSILGFFYETGNHLSSLNKMKIFFIIYLKF